jgi:hypothetical protein
MLQAGNYFPENTEEFRANQAESRTFGPFYVISTVLNHFQRFLATCFLFLVMLQEMKFWLS